MTKTLQNAIAADRVAHAILFSGPRGTGKTTVARILAKAMNCEKGPTPTPCNKCRSCGEITTSSAVDVYEIDGASNNGVEQVRELRDNIKYMPAHSRYKIYIIDEVHMLSTAAFNALLKTLEEPPPHVMFIFATTEPHKIPLTILSRCRRHDFRRIDVGSIADHLEFLCRKENIEIDRESLELVSREAGGCMRDALSLLDQVMTCSGDGLSRERILDILGVIDRKMIFDISSAILEGNVPEILSVLDEIHDRGQDMKKLYGDLLEHFRNLVVVKLGGEVEKLVDVPSHELRMMSDQVANLPAPHVSQLLDVLFREESSIRYSSQQKMALEIAFIRMCQLKPALSVDELIQKLGRLKESIDSGAAINVISEIRTVALPAGAPKAANPAPVPEKSVAGETASAEIETEIEEEEIVPGETPAEKSIEGEKLVEEAAAQEAVLENEAGEKAKASCPEQDSDPVRMASQAAGTVPVVASGTDASNEDSLAGVAPPEPEDASAGRKRSQTPKKEKFDIGEIQDPASLWKRIVGKISEKNKLLGTMLEKASLTNAAEDRLEVEAPDDGFQYKKIEKSIDKIAKTCADLFGVTPQILVKPSQSNPVDDRSRFDRDNKLKQEALNHPLVDEAIKIFNGKVLEVRISKEE